MKSQTVAEWIAMRARERLQEIMVRVKHFKLAILDQKGDPILAPIHGFTLAEIAQLKARCDLLEQAIAKQHAENPQEPTQAPVVN